jgi:hypothetical protein
VTEILTAAATAITAFLLWIWPWGAPGIEVVKLSIPESCSASAVEKKKKTLKGSDRDVLVWRITNKCGEQVRINIRSADPAPIACVGEPRTATMGSPFSLGPRKTAYLICTVHYPPCPGDPSGKACTELYRYTTDFQKAAGGTVQEMAVSELEINVDP